MAVTCTVYQWSRGNDRPASLPRKTPTEVERYENDIESDADCQGEGITVSSSLWRVHPDDDDQTLTISGSAVQGFVTSALFAGGTDGKVYRVLNDVTLSDNRQLEYMSSLPVVSTKSMVA